MITAKELRELTLARLKKGKYSGFEKRMRDERGLNDEQIADGIAAIFENEPKGQASEEALEGFLEGADLATYDSLFATKIVGYGDGVLTHDLARFEIFAEGTWNGDTYTRKDLDDMVQAAPTVGFMPPLKLGHNKKQKALKEDGLPAAGWVNRVWREGGKLFVSLIDVPAKVYKLIERGAYKQRSAEIFWNYRGMRGGKPHIYRRVLAKLALLGADIPAVKGMTPLDAALAMYGEAPDASDDSADAHVALFATEVAEPEGDEMSKELEDRLAKLEESDKARKTENEQLKTENKLLSERLAGEETARRKTDADNFADRMIREGRMLPAERPTAVALLQDLDDADASHVYEEAGADGKKKAMKGTQRRLYEVSFEQRPKHALFDETSAGPGGHAEAGGERDDAEKIPAYDAGTPEEGSHKFDHGKYAKIYGEQLDKNPEEPMRAHELACAAAERG